MRFIGRGEAAKEGVDENGATIVIDGDVVYVKIAGGVTVPYLALVVVLVEWSRIDVEVENASYGWNLAEETSRRLPRGS